MQYNFSNFKTELKKAEEFLSKEYSQLNIGRASPMVLDGIYVESYGSFVPLKNVATSVRLKIQRLYVLRLGIKARLKELKKPLSEQIWDYQWRRTI